MALDSQTTIQEDSTHLSAINFGGRLQESLHGNKKAARTFAETLRSNENPAIRILTIPHGHSDPSLMARFFRSLVVQVAERNQRGDCEKTRILDKPIELMAATNGEAAKHLSLDLPEGVFLSVVKDDLTTLQSGDVDYALIDRGLMRSDNPVERIQAIARSIGDKGLAIIRDLLAKSKRGDQGEYITLNGINYPLEQPLLDGLKNAGYKSQDLNINDPMEGRFGGGYMVPGLGMGPAMPVRELRERIFMISKT